MCSIYLLKGLLACFGGFMMHLVVGSVYQWGIINVYITSYFSYVEKREQSLTVNGAVFPAMMMAIGLGMKIGNYLAELIGLSLLMCILSVIMAALVFASSYLTSFGAFVILYGVLFGFFGGMNFTSILREVNKYFVNKQVYVNGFILIGTGLGSAVFGPFSYQYLNPNKLQPVNGLYIAPGLQQIALKVPSLIRYLSLFYLCLGLSATLCILPVYLHNRNKDIQTRNKISNTSVTQIQINPQNKNNNQINETIQNNVVTPQQTNKKVQQPPPNQCAGFKAAFSQKNTYFLIIVYFLMIIGNLFVNTTYKTFVKGVILNDQFLTLVGALASIANGIFRFPANILFNKIGFKFMTTIIAISNIVLYCTIKLTIINQDAYCFMIFMCNLMLGATLAIGPTQVMKTFGLKTGADLYTVYWCTFATANFTAYGLSTSINLNILFYVFAGTSALSAIIIWFVQLQIDWTIKSQPQQIQLQSMNMINV